MIQFCPRFTVPKVRIVRVPKGPPGTIASARLIASLIREGARDFYVRQKAIEIFREAGARPNDRVGDVLSLVHWVGTNIRYTRDIFRVELLQTARRMLELRAGDCDDMTILLGAMLLATGHPVRIALTGFRPTKPHVYSHIYPEVNVKGKWIALDTTMDRPIGWAPPALWKRICDI